MKSHFVLESFVSGNKSIFEVASYTIVYDYEYYEDFKY